MSASFPTSVKSFPTRVAGQVINSSLFNEPQEEIVAIETFLFNGSTLVIKSSTGHITRYYSNAVRLLLSSATPQELSSTPNITVLVGFTSETFDANNSWDVSSTPTKIYPGTTGYYQCSAHVQWSTASTVGYRQLRLNVCNGSTATETQLAMAQIGSGDMLAVGTPSMCVSDLCYVPTTGHFICVNVAHNSGSTMSIQYASFSAVYVGE